MTSFGVFLPQGWRREFTSSENSHKAYLTLKEFASQCEKSGFNKIWLYDHFITYPPTNQICFECWTTLSAIASETRKIRFGPFVICNSYRYPSILAKMASTLDVISNGRLELGIGAGFYKHEYVAYGIPFERMMTRVEMLEETLQILKQMWSKERVNFKGKHHSLKDAINSPKPLQKPHPPIWIGGGGERILRLVAKFGDGCNFDGSPFEYQCRLRILEKYCKEIGRNIESIRKSIELGTIITKKKNGINKQIRKYKVLTAPHLTMEEFMKRRLIGTPEDCIKKINEYLDVGVTDFMLYFLGPANTNNLRLFGEHIIPEFCGK